MEERNSNIKNQGNDNLGIALVSAPLDGRNYLSWARSIEIALGARQKLGYIDGTYEKPTEGKEAMEQWRKNDYMVVSWILNSISKGNAEAFLYAKSTRDLWMELKMRFGESNEPLLYQIQRDISSISQRNMSVVEYFTKLKRLWDELISLNPLPVCSCGASKKISYRMEAYQLIQFLMGLGDPYDHVRNQILHKDPLPTAAKAYSMVHRVEKQREVNSGISEIEKEGVMAVQGNFKKAPMDKKQLLCEHCKKRGHLKEGCFELIGFPNWYKGITDKGKTGGKQLNFRSMNVRAEQEANNLLTTLNTKEDKRFTEIVKRE
ncbi:UNVERIFIED_CONTAM: hypothetical protein Sindi_1878300, partial [Sesamum indicum]